MPPNPVLAQLAQCSGHIASAGQPRATMAGRLACLLLLIQDSGRASGTSGTARPCPRGHGMYVYGEE